LGFEIINMALICWEPGTTVVQVQAFTSSEPNQILLSYYYTWHKFTGHDGCLYTEAVLTLLIPLSLLRTLLIHC